VMAAPVPVAPEVGVVTVASPAGVLELDTHSSLEADPSESSPPPISVAPMVSPFLCSDDSESDTEIPKRHVSPTTSIPEIPTTPILPAPSAIVAPSSEYPLTPVVAPPGIRRRRAILIRPREDIPIGRLYGTHPGGPCRALTVRKSVRPLTSHRLALRYTSHHLDHFTSGSSSSHSYSDHSSSGHSVSGHSLPGHTPPDTTDADSSTPSRFVHPSLTRTPRAGDSSSESSAGPSHKRCRSPASIVTSSIHATRALVPSRADFLLPCKRFRDSISPEDIVEEDIDTDVLEDIETGQRELESRSLIVGGERASLLEQVVSLEGSNRPVLQMLSRRKVNQNGSDDDNGNGGNGNGGDGNGGNRNGGYGNPNENNRDARPVARECSYQDFMKCQPLNFKATKGVARGILELRLHLPCHVYCPRNEIQKMESELWNLTVKNNDLTSYTQRFQELTMMCTKMVPEEEDRVEKFIGDLPDNI
ncbi:reverse transcriptase domain-containing protein, partial [Tanacetum coccineum]